MDTKPFSGKNEANIDSSQKYFVNTYKIMPKTFQNLNRIL